ncbi:TPA: phage major capsid protein, P2 family [Klebsiella pneumoniae]|nr:phage major capsid protein, P2 family [Klebsiella pneumoniae]
MLLNNRAREFLEKHKTGLEKSYGVKDASKYFALTDPKEISLRAALLDEVDFLNMITCIDVDQLSGQVISVGNPGIFTGRRQDGRFMRKVGVSGNDYALSETDSGAALRWDVLSVWANAGGENEFFERMQAFINQSFALDMLRIGFNGTHVADDTDADKYPNGEDVNIGWHQIAKDWEGGKQVITTPVTLDDAGDFRSLDAMAQDIVNTCIPVQFRNDPRLTVLVGAELVAAEQNRLYNAADRPTEKIAAQMLGTTIAGRPAYIPPFMPGKRMVVTIPANLHIYTQRNTRQRKAEFVEDRKQYENKYLRNEGYALEYRELYGAYDESAVTIGKVTEQSEKMNIDQETHDQEGTE